MTSRFNANEILEIACKIERNGARFYRAAAKGFNDTDTRELLLDLAAMEDQHEKFFVGMQQDFAKQKGAPVVFDPEDQSVAYLQAMADGRVFDVRSDPVDMLSGLESLQDILKFAIQLEKESIVFYTGIRDIVPKDLGKNRVDDVIREEMSHVVLLSNTMKSL